MYAVVKSKDKLIFIILALYFFLVVFGNIFRLGSEETGYGLSTILLVAVIFFKFKYISRDLFSHTLFLTILYLFLWCMISAMFSATSIITAYVKLGMLYLYLFVAISAYETQLTENRVRILIYSLGISILIASTLTIIDFLKIYNIPYVNEGDVTTKIAGGRIEQAGGFFPRRSAMAAYYSIIIPTLLYYAFKVNNVKEKIFLLGASGASILALFLTHNRSGIVGVLLALFFYMAIDTSIKFSRKISIIMYMPFVFGILLFIAYYYFPLHFNVYIMKFASYIPGGVENTGVQTEANYIESDYSRIYFFKSVMQSLITNPIGNGFSKIYTENYGVSSPHNILTYVIWAAGVVSFVWIPLFAYQIKKHFSLKKLRTSKNVNENLMAMTTAFQVGLLSWLLNNMAHNSLSTGLAWLYLGVILNLMSRLKKENDEPDAGNKEMVVDEQKPQRYLHLRN